MPRGRRRLGLVQPQIEEEPAARGGKPIGPLGGRRRAVRHEQPQRPAAPVVVSFVQRRLFRPLGMTRTHMSTDRAGNPAGSGTVVKRPGTAVARPQPPTFGPRDASRVVTDAVKR